MEGTVTVLANIDVKSACSRLKGACFSQIMHMKTYIPVFCYLDIEEDMFNLASDSGYPEVFMRPQESLNIPFKYQSFKTTYEQDSSNPLGTKIKEVTRKITNNGQLPRSIKVKHPFAFLYFLLA